MVGNVLATAHLTPSSRRWKTNIKTAVLIEAVKELKAQNAAFEARFAQIETALQAINTTSSVRLAPVDNTID